MNPPLGRRMWKRGYPLVGLALGSLYKETPCVEGAWRSGCQWRCRRICLEDRSRVRRRRRRDRLVGLKREREDWIGRRMSLD